MERLARLLTGLAIAVVGVAGFASTGFAHDEIESSVPAQGDQLDEPITEVTVTFDQPVTGVELALVGPDDEELNDVLGSQLVQLDNFTARLTFAPLPREGEYLVRYLAEENGHLAAGAFTFVYGDRDGGGTSSTVWFAFGLVAVAVLAAGTVWSLRLARRNTADDATD